MSKFQVIILGVFGFVIILSVVIFSRYRGSGEMQADISVWGTISESQFQSVIGKTTLFNNKLLRVTYEQRESDRIDSDFVEALAVGKSPDLILIGQDKISKYKNKVTIVPFASYSERSFKDTFIAGTEIFLDSTGTVALPVAADPLIMYWNRAILTNSNITEPPKYWDQFYVMSQTVSKKDGALNISQSLAPLGEYSNISNAKAIISSLMMQAGTPIVTLANGMPYSVMSATLGKPLIPAESALNFYVEFSNPAKPFYSWNRSLSSSQNYFISGNLALYFGYAGELFDIQRKNPNLDFDVALLPSSRDGGVNTSYSKYYGLAISRGSKNATAAFQVASILASKEGGTAFAEALSLAPVRRDLLNVKPSDPYKEVFWTSAIRSNAWFDPDPVKTDTIFREMIESVTSGRERVSAAINKASNQLNDMFK